MEQTFGLVPNFAIWGGIAGFLLLVLLTVLARFYHRATKEIAFVRTGLGGERVIMDGGALKLPVFHEIMPVNMRTLRLQVDRKNEEESATASSRRRGSRSS